MWKTNMLNSLDLTEENYPNIISGFPNLTSVVRETCIFQCKKEITILNNKLINRNYLRYLNIENVLLSKSIDHDIKL